MGNTTKPNDAPKNICQAEDNLVDQWYGTPEQRKLQ